MIKISIDARPCVVIGEMDTEKMKVGIEAALRMMEGVSCGMVAELMAGEDLSGWSRAAVGYKGITSGKYVERTCEYLRGRIGLVKQELCEMGVRDYSVQRESREVGATEEERIRVGFRVEEESDEGIGGGREGREYEEAPIEFYVWWEESRSDGWWRKKGSLYGGISDREIEDMIYYAAKGIQGSIVRVVLSAAIRAADEADYDEDEWKERLKRTGASETDIEIIGRDMDKFEGLTYGKSIIRELTGARI